MSSTQIAYFFRQFGSMLEAGLPALRGLHTLETSFPGRMRRIAGLLRKRIEAGGTLHQAMAEQGSLFQPIELALIHAGESSGRLDRMMIELAERREDQHRVKKGIVTRMVYPAILLHVGIAAGTILAVVSPDGGPEAGIRFGLTALIWLYAVVLGIYVVLKDRERVPWFSHAVDRVAYFAPISRGLVRQLCLVRFCQAFEAMYVAGISHPRALTLSADASGNIVVANRLRAAVPMVSQGVDLGEALQKVRAFDPMTTGRLITGVQSGRLEETLISIRKGAELNAQTTINRLAIVLPTLLYIGIMLWVGICVVMKFWLSYFRQLEEVLG